MKTVEDGGRMSVHQKIYFKHGGDFLFNNFPPQNPQTVFFAALLDTGCALSTRIISTVQSIMFDLKLEEFSDPVKDFVFAGFERHSIQMTGNEEKGSPVCLVARVDDKIVGALVCVVFWGALHIKYIMTDESYRGKRLGSRLMEEAEKYGKEHKCGFSFLETMSFQAPDFYLKSGYHLEFTREGFSHGSSFHYLRKNFVYESINIDTK